MARRLLQLLLLSLPVVSTAGLYTKGSSVLQVDAKSYNGLIAKSNYTSVVEFYAPWCGHCQNLKPAYEKAAASLDGIANVAAINCDEDDNKPFCGSMGVQGFPTLKIVKPSKKPGGRPNVEDYQGPRTTKAIREALLDKMPNHVTKIKDNSLDDWLKSDGGQPKALVFSDKGTISPLIKALAIDFLGSISVGHIRSTDKNSVERFGIKSFPTIVLLPEGEETGKVVFDGEVNKSQLISFMSQAAAPNPAYSSKDAKGSKKSSSRPKKEAKAERTKKDKAKAPHDVPDGREGEACPYNSPNPNIATNIPKPIRVPVEPAPELVVLDSEQTLQRTCIHSKASTCILALTSTIAEGLEPIEPARILLLSLAEIAHKHAQRGAKMFPFYHVPDNNDAGRKLATNIGLEMAEESVALFAINAKRGWWQQYSIEEWSSEAIESWIDKIRFGEGSKNKLPSGLVIELEEVSQDAEPEQSAPIEDLEETELENMEDDTEHDEL